MKYLGGAFTERMPVSEDFREKHKAIFGEKRKIGLDCKEGRHGECDRGPQHTGTCECLCHHTGAA